LRPTLRSAGLAPDAAGAVGRAGGRSSGLGVAGAGAGDGVGGSSPRLAERAGAGPTSSGAAPMAPGATACMGSTKVPRSASSWPASTDWFDDRVVGRLVDRLGQVRLGRRLDQGLDVEDVAEIVIVDGVEQLAEHREALSLPRDERILLAHGTQVDALAQVVHLARWSRQRWSMTWSITSRSTWRAVSLPRAAMPSALRSRRVASSSRLSRSTSVLEASARSSSTNLVG